MSHPSHLTPQLLRIIFLVLLMTTLFLSCATSPEKKLVKDRVTLQYIPKTSKKKELKDIRLDHPAQITPKQLRNHLLSLRYEQFSLFGKKSPVYSGKDVDRISQLLARAFHQAPSGSIISYRIKTANGETEGDTFVSQNKINWRFTTIQGLDFVNSSSSNTSGTLATLWRLIPQKGQGLHVTEQLIGKKKWDNWIVANLNFAPTKNRIVNKKNPTVQRNIRSNKHLTKPAQNSKKNPSKQEFLKAGPELEKKLKFLKNLREKELIYEKEFEQKRKELLDRFL